MKRNYKGVERSDLILLTASLLFSLIPLHDPPLRPVFYKMCAQIHLLLVITCLILIPLLKLGASRFLVACETTNRLGGVAQCLRA